MFEKHVCPVCWAFQNPKDGRCLACGKSYIILMNEPVDIYGDNPPRDYCMPVIMHGKYGILTFQGALALNSVVDNYTQTFSFTIDITPETKDNALYSLTLTD